MDTGKPRSTAWIIRDNLEEAIRLVCRYFNSSPLEAWKMDTFEFFRDVKRATILQEQEIQNAKKWQTKQ